MIVMRGMAGWAIEDEWIDLINKRAISGRFPLRSGFRCVDRSTRVCRLVGMPVDE